MIQTIELIGFGNYRNESRGCRVKKITKTQIVLENGSRYRRKDGRGIPYGIEWSGYKISPASLMAVEQAEEQEHGRQGTQ